MHLAAQKICMLVVGKEVSTLSTLHGIVNNAKTGQEKFMLQPMSASRCSVAQNYFWSSLRILFMAFLETKTQLWKLMSAISECCNRCPGKAGIIIDLMRYSFLEK